jgi:hypothetical protein
MPRMSLTGHSEIHSTLGAVTHAVSAAKPNRTVTMMTVRGMVAYPLNGVLVASGVHGGSAGDALRTMPATVHAVPKTSA